MAVDAHPVYVYELMPGGQLLDGVFLVFQAIVPEVPVAVVVVPLGTVGMTAAVTNGDNDHADLGQPVRAGEAGAPGDVVGLHLRAGIHIIGNGIYLGGVKVEGLVHGPVQVRDAVGRLHLEAFREFIPGCQELGEIGLFQGGALAAGCADEAYGGLAVHTGIIGYQVLAVIRASSQHVHVVHVQLHHGSAGKRYAEVVHLVGVLLRIHAAGANHKVAVAHTQHVLHMEGAFGEVLLAGAVGPVQIDVGPTVALAPPQEVPVGKETRVAGLHIGVHALCHDGLGAVGIDIHAAQVLPFEVSAKAHEVEVIVVAHPSASGVILVAVGHLRTLSQKFAVLVLEGVPGYLLAVSIQVKHIQEALCARLSRHLVMVAFQLRTRLGQGVDNPQLLDVGHIPADGGKVLAVRGPHYIGHPAGGGVLLRISAVVASAPGERLGAVFGELTLYQCGVLGILGGLLEVLLVHHIQVVVLEEDTQLTVRRHVGPTGIFGLMLFRVPGEFPGVYVVVEPIFYKVFGIVPKGILLHGLGRHVPLEALVFLELQALDGEMLGIVRVPGNLRELAGQFLQVKDFLLGAGGGIHNVIVGAIGRSPTIPETVAAGEPVGTDLGRIHHLAHFFGGKPFGQVVIGLGNLPALAKRGHAQKHQGRNS